MEKQAKQNLLSFIKGLESTVELREKEPESIIRTNYYSIHQLISNTRDYAESIKRLVFNKVVSLTYKREIDIKEFNEINDCLNHQFNLVEEFIEDNLPELYDKNVTTFMEIYFNIESGLESVYYTIKDL